MIAVDTNILVYAHRRDTDWHQAAAEAVKGLAESRGPWGIPWPCIHEFLAVVTHPRIYDPPSSMEAALDQIAAWMESPSLVMLPEAHGYTDHLARMLVTSRVVGARVHHARIAALCVYHGVRELWSADRDFSRFPGPSVRNPLLA
ncbi:MAG: PIN domain-containing protein [Gemmatimonadetes bacterium]|nr:PIN domain-containing protein [Gemmatimonadota bacterium]NNM04516.1 PIN domain-containing protein [Gemmatimonadota bacterium]